MLSISHSKTAQSGSSYFEKDSYYATGENTSKWYGRGAQELGLSGGVRKEPFDIVLNGFDLQMNPLVANAGSEKVRDKNEEYSREGRKAYIDLTFSAPKSVSLMSYVDSRIELAHNRAVERAIAEIENNYTFTRKTVDGELQTVQENNAIIARINHFESRELDPQLHSHLVLMNLTKGDDGKWRSRENSKIYQNQLYLGQVYRNSLSQELETLGYHIEVTDRQLGFYEISGISREIIDEFSTRRKQVLEAIEDYSDYECSEAQKAQYACLHSRKEKTDSTVEQIRETTNERLKQKYGQSLADLKAKALAAGESVGPKISREEAIRMAIDEVTDKQSGFRKEDVLVKAMKATVGRYSVDELCAAFDADTTIQTLGEKDRFSLHAKHRELLFTTSDILATEQSIMSWAKEGRGTCAAAIGHENMEEHFERLRNKGIDFTKGQEDAVRMVCTTTDRLSLIQGDAGAGKSYAMGKVREIMEAQGYKVRGFTPTGKASQSMIEAGVESMTIDKILSSIHHRGELQSGEVWLVDEAGMVGSRKMERFLRLAQEKQSKVVLIGDTKQFQSVEQGKIFSDLQEHAGVAKAEILEVKRQKTEIAKQIVKAIKEKDFDLAFETLERTDSIHEIKETDQRQKAITEAYLSDRAQKKDCVILSQTNEQKNVLNSQIRARLVEQAEVEEGGRFQMYQKASIDKVSCHFADSYKNGQVVIFKRDCDVLQTQPAAGGAKSISSGVEGRIVSIDKTKNAAFIRYWDKNAKQYKDADVDLLKHGKKFQVFDVVEKEFGVGDKVLFCKNDNKVNVSNGESGVIEEIDSEGTAHIKITDKKTVRCNLGNRGERGYTYLDHAYCITDHKSQGATFDTVIVANEASSASSFNSFYVEATRMRQAVTVFTNNKLSLREQVQLDQVKYSTHDAYDFTKYERIMEQNRLQAGQELTMETNAAVVTPAHSASSAALKPLSGTQVLEKPKPKKKDTGIEL